MGESSADNARPRIMISKTHRALLANALQTLSWLPKVREGEEVMLCVAPFFHTYDMTVGMNFSIRAAAMMVLLPSFKPKDVVKVIRQYHPTMFPGIPTMYLAVMREAGRRDADGYFDWEGDTQGIACRVNC